MRRSLEKFERCSARYNTDTTLSLAQGDLPPTPEIVLIKIKNASLDIPQFLIGSVSIISETVSRVLSIRLADLTSRVTIKSHEEKKGLE